MFTTALRLTLAALIVGSAAASARAQDQTIILSAPANVCPTSPPAPSSFDETAAAALITAVTGAAPAEDTYYLMHAVSFAGRGLAIGEQKWFVYHKPWHDATGAAHILDARVKKHFEESRVFGSRKLALVYLLNGVPVVRRAEARTAIEKAFRTSVETPESLDPKVAAAELKKELALGLRFPDDRRREKALAKSLGVETFEGSTDAALLGRALVQVMTENLVAKEFDAVPGASTFNLISLEGEPLAALTPELLSTQSFAALADLRYRVDVTKKEPAPLLNLKGVLGIIAQAAPRDIAIPVTTTALCGVVPFSIAPLPADMKLTAIAQEGGDQTEIGKNTYDNERKYWFDFGFALPVKRYEDLTVDVDEGGVAAKSAERTDLFAAVMVNPVPFDTKKASWHWVPGLVYGMPITGNPLKRHLFAATIGLTRAQLFAGVLVSKRESVAASAEDGVTTATVSKADAWTTSFTWGINLSVKNVTDLLKK